MELKLDQNVNKLFEPLWKEQTRYYILMGGRGAGRSTAGSQYALSRLNEPDFFRCAIMRANHSDIRHSLWRELSDRIDEQGVREALRVTENDMHVEYGENTINAHGFRTSSGSHTAKLKSLANYNTVLVEEAEEIGEREFTTLDDTLRTKRGNIRIVLMLNSPAKAHWMISRFFDLEPHPNVKGFYLPIIKPDANAVYIGGTYRDNLDNLDETTVKRYEAYKRLKPDYYWQMIEGLVPDTVRGKIYHGWEQIDEIPKEARLVGFGEDFGWFPDPAAVVAIYYLNGGYIVHEVAYGTELDNKHLAGQIKAHGRAVTIADAAEPKSIDEQNKCGIKVEPSLKGGDAVNYRIKVTAGKRIAVTKSSENIWREYENYAWAEDKDGNPKGVPVHDFSHSMDALGQFFAWQEGGGKTGTKATVSGPNFVSYGHTDGSVRGKGVKVNTPGVQKKPKIDYPKGW